MTDALSQERLASLCEMLANRVLKNRRRLLPWAKREQISCYRLYDRDIPELPLAIDWYEGRLHAAVYQKTGHELGEVEARALVLAVAGALGVPASDVFLKQRERQKAGAQYERVAKQGAWFTVAEAGRTFSVNLSDYLDTGLFLDHRRTRALVAAEAAGKHVLNLFCYTASFSVYAATAGATSTTSVNLSNTYLDWAEQNLALNRCAKETNAVVRADVLAWLDERHQPRGGYGLAVLDPPTISRSKRMAESFDVQRDHVRLINGTLELLAPTGVLYFSTNFHRFKLDEPALNAPAAEITEQTTPFDYRDRRVHRCFRLAKQEAPP